MGTPGGRGPAAILDRLIPGPGSVVEPLAQWIQRTLGRVQGTGAGRAVVTTLRGNDWFGHPLHPIAVTVPIGAWVTTAFFDLRSLSGGRPGDEHAADTALRLGVLTAVPAAVTGWAQFLDTSGGARRQTLIHAALNGAGVALNIWSLAVRASGHRRAGHWLSGAALTVVGASGYLGGDLAYRHGVGVSPNHRSAQPIPAQPASDDQP
jgi:uncharacterized membrane protein